jgi:NRPS condensation-like uncharacterized protein
MNRLLAPTEHLMWLSSENSPENVVLCATIRGMLSVKKLTEALAWVQRRHSRLGLRIVVEQNNRPRFVSENVPTIPLQVIPRQGAEHWCQVVQEELLHPIPWNIGPLLRFVLLQSPNEANLILTFDHCIGDGLSAAYLIRDILRYIAEPDSDRSLLPDLPPIDELIEKTASDTVEQENKEWTQLPEVALLPHSQQKQDFSDWQLRLLHWNFSNEDTTQLVARCREEQTTVHGAICASFFLALATEKNLQLETVIYCLSPISLRKYLHPPIGENFGEYITRSVTSHTITKSSEFWDLARDVKHKLNLVVTEGKLFEDVSRARSLLSNCYQGERFVDFRNEFSIDLVITNMGRLNIPHQFNDLELEELYVTVTGPKTLPIIIGVVTLKGRMCLTWRYPESVLPNASAQRMKLEAMQRLSDAAQLKII